MNVLSKVIAMRILILLQGLYAYSNVKRALLMKRLETFCQILSPLTQASLEK